MCEHKLCQSSIMGRSTKVQGRISKSVCNVTGSQCWNSVYAHYGVWYYVLSNLHLRCFARESQKTRNVNSPERIRPLSSSPTGFLAQILPSLAFLTAVTSIIEPVLGLSRLSNCLGPWAVHGGSPIFTFYCKNVPVLLLWGGTPKYSCLGAKTGSAFHGPVHWLFLPLLAPSPSVPCWFPSSHIACNPHANHHPVASLPLVGISDKGRRLHWAWRQYD